MSIFAKILGDPNEREIDKIKPLVDQINQLESKFEHFSNDELKSQTENFRKDLQNGKTLDDILPQAFCVVREAAKRTLGLRHYDSQLLAGIALHQGKISEQKTGEGKTLSATLAVYLNALGKQGVHVVTVNDYLSLRDANWMGPIYHLLGLSCSAIGHEKSFIFEPEVVDKNEVTIEHKNLKEVSRGEAYQADVLYGTNNELGFDYLRDNMAQVKEQIVQRELNFAIVDEVDSILIDEARTPLIISAPDEESTKMYEQFSRIVPQLKENQDYNIDEKMRAATLTEEGISKVEKILGMSNIYDEGGIKIVHHLEQALRAEVLFKRDRDYVVKNNEVIIVDDFTGRLMPGRRYSGGLHQALEAKERVSVQKESRTLATITFQNYFRMYKKLAGMTGTALTSAEEFHKVYNLDILVVPPNKPLKRNDQPDAIYKNEQAKFKAVVEDVKKCNQKGQPVLIGTISIEKNEFLSQLLNREGIKHQILNAKQHEKEAEIIAQAGRKGAVTVATNMAGRGVDIILGGHQPALDSKSKKDTTSRSLEEWQKEHDEVVEAGGLRIIGTERHEARRIDNQLRGRAGRQGDPGATQFFVSLEDDLMRIFGGDKLKRLMERFNLPDEQIIENSLVSKAIESAQARIEGYNFDLRKHILEYDDVMNKQRELIYKKRHQALFAESIKDEIIDLVKKEIENIIRFHTQDPIKENWNLKEIEEILKTLFLLPEDFSEQIKKFENPEMILDFCEKLVLEAYEKKEKEFDEKKEETKLSMRDVEKFVYLRNIDMLWMDHLDNMEYLRDSVRLRAYGQKDPLVEYKNEGHRLFKRLVEAIQANTVNMIFKVGLSQKPSYENNISLKAKPKDSENKTIGRNDPCPCGSGKKYKKCCGK